MRDVATSRRPAQPGPFAQTTNVCRRQQLVDLAERISRTVALARALILGGRQLDVTGIDDGVGILCAQTLDLPPEDAGTMLPVLRGVLIQVELLAAALHKPADGQHLPC